METTICTHCNAEKPIKDFYKRRDRPKGHVSECKQCFKTRKRRDYATKPNVNAREKEWSRRTYERLKAEVIQAYGGKCSCCGESEPAFLTVDHRDGSGADRRRNGEGSGSGLYFKLRKLGYPTDNFQLLCFNCNCAKRQTGICPHQSARQASGACAA